MPKTVLVIEDDADIAETVKYNLQSEGFAVQIAVSGEDGLSRALDSPPALIILDLMLPGMGGMDVCRRLRNQHQTHKTPIIMLTAKASEADRVAGLDVGADDYLGKPFSVRELLARVRAVLRRAADATPEIYDDGRLKIDFDDVRASCDQVAVKLTNKEFSLLSALAKKRGRVATRQQLLDQVWGYRYYGDARTLDVHIRRLRQKLGACGDCIETVVATGYRFVGCSGKTSGNFS